MRPERKESAQKPEWFLGCCVVLGLLHWAFVWTVAGVGPVPRWVAAIAVSMMFVAGMCAGVAVTLLKREPREARENG